MSQNNEIAAMLETAWRAYCAAPTHRDCGRSKVDAAVLAALDAQKTDRIESALASAEPVAIVGERGDVSWRSETILPVGTKLYTHAHPAAKVEAPGDGLRDYPYLIGLAKVLRMRGDPENANALDSVAERIRRTAPTPASVPDAVLEVSRRLIREAIPATASGQTCFVPKYVIAQLADAIGFFTTPEPTP